MVDLAGDGGWNVERMEALAPGLVLGSPAYDLSTRGWPMVPVTEYLEAHPLGRAEWMVPLAWMMGDSLAGARAFAAIQDRYQSLAAEPVEGGREPTVLMGSVADGVWHAPGQKRSSPVGWKTLGDNMASRKRTKTATWRSGWNKCWTTLRNATCG